MIKNFKDYLVEETKEVFFTFGRMNPPTIGHGKVLDTIASKSRGSDWKVYLSHTTGPKDPLSYSDKIKHLRKMFPKYGRNIIVDKGVKNVFDIAKVLYDAGYKHINMVVGEDRLREFDVLLNKYNGKKARHGFYNFESIKVVSAGQRDPDAEGVAGMSASKQRKNATDNNYQAFTLGVPKNMNDKDTRKLFNDVRKGLGLDEQITFKNHIDLGKKDDTREAYVNGTLFELGDTVVIKESDEIGTVTVLGANYVIVECGDKKLRKWLDAVQLVERQDSDIKDKKGTQPARYYQRDARGKGMATSTKSKRDAHFNKGKAMDDDNPNAYKPAPGDKSAKTKPSKYTKDYEKMFGENAGEIGTDKLKKKYEDDTPLEELFGRNVDLSGNFFLSNFDGVLNKDVHVKLIRKWIRDTNKKDWNPPTRSHNKKEIPMKISDAETARMHLGYLAKGSRMPFRTLEKLLFKMIDNKTLPKGYDYRNKNRFMKEDVTHSRKDLAKRITEARSKRLKK